MAVSESRRRQLLRQGSPPHAKHVLRLRWLIPMPSTHCRKGRKALTTALSLAPCAEHSFQRGTGREQASTHLAPSICSFPRWNGR